MMKDIYLLLKDYQNWNVDGRLVENRLSDSNKTKQSVLAKVFIDLIDKWKIDKSFLESFER